MSGPLNGGGGFATHAGHGAWSVTARREPPDSAEARRPDGQLDAVIGVRRQRQQRLERERAEALRHWRATRTALAQAKAVLRAQRLQATTFWRQARADFFSMRSNSLEFRAAKAGYARQQQLAEQRLLDWRRSRALANQAGAAFFGARRAAALARLQQEKLQLLREEMALSLHQRDD